MKKTRMLDYSREKAAERFWDSKAGKAIIATKRPVLMRGTFHECEHSGDMERYEDDVRKAGGRVLHSHVNYATEIGAMDFEVENETAFRKAFAQTESAGFARFFVSIGGLAS